MNKFLEIHELRKLSQEELYSLSTKGKKFLVENLPQRNLKAQMVSLVNNNKHLWKKLCDFYKCWNTCPKY